MDEQRAEFEAWVKSTASPDDGWWCRQLDDGGYSSGPVDDAWKGWKAATQRQRERIAELEAQVQALSESREPPPPMTNEEIFRIGDKHMMGCSSGGLICAVRETELRFGVQPPQCDRCREYPGFCDRYECHGLNIDAAIAAGKGEG